MADPVLDAFFADVPKSVDIRDVECRLDGKLEEPHSMDRFSVAQDANGIWGITLYHSAHGSMTAKISEENARYTVTKTFDGKKLAIDFRLGSDMELVFEDSKLRLVMYFPDGGRVLECVYR